MINRITCFSVFFILLGNANLAFSQEHHSFIGYSMGPSFPVGKYYLNDLQNGSYANPGITFSLVGSWYFLPYLGIGAQISENIHPLDVANLTYDKVVADQFMEQLNLQSEPYEIRTYMAGINFKWPIWKEKIYILAKGMAGMIWMRTPDQLHGATFFMGIEHSYWITSARDKKFAFIAGTALEYSIFERAGLLLSAEYSGRKMEFTYYTSATSSYEKIHQITYINVALGINLYL
jgi:hypothetical protein